MEVLCSTGALIGRPNGRDYRLLEELAGKLSCDGFEFMMYDSWYGEQDEIVRFLRKLGLHIPVMHCEKRIGETISIGGAEGSAEAFRLFEINCRMARALGAEKLVLHLWDGLTSDSHFENNLEAYGELSRISVLYSIRKWRPSTRRRGCCISRSTHGSGTGSASAIIMSTITAEGTRNGGSCGRSPWGLGMWISAGSLTASWEAAMTEPSRWKPQPSGQTAGWTRRC